MKIAAPQLATQLDEIYLEDFLDGEILNAKLSGVDATGCFAPRLDATSLLIEKSQLTAAQLEKMNGLDIVARQTDFSSTYLSGCSIARAEFNSCRLIGIDFSRSNLRDAVFIGCKLNMSNFRFSNLRRVNFIDCSFNEADFLGASFYEASFDNCLLEKTVFDQVKIKKLDLRTSQLIDISGWRDLKGSTIDSVQLISIAPHLAQEIGLIIRND